MCNVGSSGYAFLGATNTTIVGGIGNSGQVIFDVTADEPCVVALINKGGLIADISILGNNVTA
jgi:hypothetical protein